MNMAVVCLAIALLALAVVLLPRARPRAGPLDPATSSAIVDLSKSLVDSEASMLTNRLREQGNLLGTLARRRLRRRGAARPGGGRGGGARAPPSTTSATPQRLLVLGIVSNPRTPHVRGWIRGTYLQRLPPPEEALLRFVFGRRGLTPADLKAVRAERREHRDVELIDASDFGERGGIFSCIDKLFEWFPHAVRTYPGAAFYGKVDDDTLLDVRRTLAVLRPVVGAQNAYLGYLQYDSFLPAKWKHCGWAAGPVGAAHAFAHGGCPRGGGAEGPFPFVVGALTVMGADLAGWMEASPYVKAFVAAGRASQASRDAHWDCGYSDVTLGYVLSKSNLSLSVVSLRDALRDATYGAMNARRFVAAHHLRTKAQFDAAQKDADAQGAWAPDHKPCRPWPEAHLATTWKGDPSGGGEESAKLGAAMRAFGCCQAWQLCEVTPGAT